jgi:hypothetical protein
MATKVQSTLRTQRGAAAELKGFMYRRNRSIGMAPGNSENIMISRAMLEAKRWARNAFGFALLVLGIIAIPTPGPGLLLFMLGLATLAAEFAWARYPAHTDVWRNLRPGEVRDESQTTLDRPQFHSGRRYLRLQQQSQDASRGDHRCYHHRAAGFS